MSVYHYTQTLRAAGTQFGWVWCFWVFLGNAGTTNWSAGYYDTTPRTHWPSLSDDIFVSTGCPWSRLSGWVYSTQWNSMPQLKWPTTTAQIPKDLTTAIWQHSCQGIFWRHTVHLYKISGADRGASGRNWTDLPSSWSPWNNRTLLFIPSHRMLN